MNGEGCISVWWKIVVDATQRTHCTGLNVENDSPIKDVKDSHLNKEKKDENRNFKCIDKTIQLVKLT